MIAPVKLITKDNRLIEMQFEKLLEHMINPENFNDCIYIDENCNLSPVIYKENKSLYELFSDGIFIQLYIFVQLHFIL